MLIRSTKDTNFGDIPVRKHKINLEDTLLLGIDEYNYDTPKAYYVTKWFTNLSGELGYKFILEMYEVLMNTHPNPKVTYGFKEIYEDIPLAEFLDSNRPNFHSSDFSIFRIDAGAAPNGTAFVYQRVLSINDKIQPELGLVSDYDLSHIIPLFLMKSSPFSERVDEKELGAELQRIQGRYNQLLFK